MIPPQVIEEIKYRNNIEDVVSGYVTLKRAGSNMVGLCPFHNEKSPSFTVFTATSGFYCFGCGAGGDVISFIMRAENLTYIEAVEFLAKRAGITIPKDGAYGREDSVSRERLYAMNRDAAKFFHACLKNDGKAMDYLTGRGLSGAVINHFGLGYAPDGFGELTGAMKALGYTDEELYTGFLCGKSKKTGRPFDYFRGRVMFPIIDTSKNVVAFGGRVMDGSLPKYLNSSDTPVFKKSRNLFALNFAKSKCAEQMILCEGYMDVIALHGAGFENAVATLGTAITPEHARMMKRYTKSVIISYDADDPGQKAADKAFRLLAEVGLDCKILRVTGAKDPDEFIKKYGPERFKRLIDGSASRFQFQTDNILKKYNIEDQDEKIKAAKELCAVIAEVYSEVERDVYLRSTAEKLSLPYESLKNDVKRMIAANMKERGRDETRKIRLDSAGYGDRVNPDSVKNIGAARSEEAILGILLLYPEYFETARDAPISLTEADFTTELGTKIFGYISRNIQNGKLSDASLNEEFSQDEVSRITRMKIEREGLTSNGPDVLL